MPGQTEVRGAIENRTAKFWGSGWLMELGSPAGPQEEIAAKSLLSLHSGAAPPHTEI